MLRYLKAVIFWVNFVLLTSLLFGVLLVVVGWCKLFCPDQLSIAAHRIAIIWGRGIILLTPGWRYHVSGLENLPQSGERPCVMVANHQSAADIFALYLLGAQFRWLSKDAVFKVPLIGQAMRWAGYVPIKRTHRGSHGAALRASSEWLRRGISMVFFPEGTRSEDGQLKDFKSGAFRLALDEGVDILPIILRGTRDMVQKKSALPQTAQLELEILPRVRALPGESSEAFALRVHKIFGECLKIEPMKRPRRFWLQAKKVPRREPLS